MSRTTNHIDYIEFAAPDFAPVKAFYSAAFGWTFQDWGDDYISFEGAGRDGGFRKGEPASSGALVVLYAEDIDDASRRVIDGGGEIIERHEFPGGKRFHFRDPVGNILAVWTSMPIEE
ncbi:MAG: VOC family protein [Marinicaulis sp.]|nr:hypothetical protein [Marinicaulis sp.]NNE41219.1 VOC family protein [Marinicaulis sp.]NNL87476.1 VOC family protein [Marinicaulis sp.]